MLLSLGFCLGATLPGVAPKQVLLFALNSDYSQEMGGGQLSGVLGISNLAQENKTIAQPFVLWEQVFQMVNKEQQHVPLLMVHLFIFPWIFTCWPFSEFYIFITGTCSHSLTTAPLLLSIISVLILISLS